MAEALILRHRLAQLDEAWDEAWADHPGGPPDGRSLARLARVIRLMFLALPLLATLLIAVPLIMKSHWTFTLPGVGLLAVSLAFSALAFRRLSYYQGVLQRFTDEQAALRARLAELE